MAEIKPPTVVNTHWFGGIDKLPSTAFYVGRPSKYGNLYSSKSGQYTKQQCVALHRVDLYHTLTRNPQELITIRQDLDGKDLACWCKQPKRLVACHGDNYLHILSERLTARTYDKSVTFYLMDDIRFVLSFLDGWIRKDSDPTQYLFLYLHLQDVRTNIDETLRICRVHEVPLDTAHYLLGQIAVGLELAAQEDTGEMLDYRFAHIFWILDCFLKKNENLAIEPVNPSIPLKKGKS